MAEERMIRAGFLRVALVDDDAMESLNHFMPMWPQLLPLREFRVEFDATELAQQIPDLAAYNELVDETLRKMMAQEIASQIVFPTVRSITLPPDYPMEFRDG